MPDLYQWLARPSNESPTVSRSGTHRSLFVLAFPNRNPHRHRNLMSRVFEHEKLEVCRAALAFLDWLEPMLPELPKSLSLTITITIYE
jgi:hypothetical protein